MVNPVLIAIGTYLLAEGYNRFVPGETKRRWENKIRVHHGEAGILFTIGGIVAKSPGLTASGISLILHDRNDWRKWFRN